MQLSDLELGASTKRNVGRGALTEAYTQITGCAYIFAVSNVHASPYDLGSED